MKIDTAPDDDIIALFLTHPHDNSDQIRRISMVEANMERGEIGDSFVGSLDRILDLHQGSVVAEDDVEVHMEHEKRNARRIRNQVFLPCPKSAT